MYLADYYPTEEEMLQAYIIIVLDNDGRTSIHDASIASMSIYLVAHEGFGSCILATVYREKLREELNLPDGFNIVLLVSLGYPTEKGVVEREVDGSINYWLDVNGLLHVPKRSLETVLSWNKCQKS